MLAHNLDDLRALFPALYSRRNTAGTSGRNWRVLQVPEVRLMGPFWTFGVTLAELDEAPDLDVLYEDARARKSPGHDKPYHPPTLMRAVAARFWDGRTKDDPTPSSRSRYSIVAACTRVGNGVLLPMEKAEDGGDNNYEVEERSTPLILAPFGQHPKHLDQDQGERVANIAAMRIVSGTLWFEPTKDYMATLRRALKLSEPNDDGNLLAITGEGVGFRAKVDLPWSDEPLETWLRLTARDLSAEPYEPVLRIWTDQAAAQDGQSQLDDLVQHIQGAAAKVDLRWFGLVARRQIRPEDLFWPCAFDKNLPLLLRTADATRSVYFERAALEPMLQGPAGQALSMEAREFKVWRDGGDLVIESENKVPLPKGTPAPVSPVKIDYTVESGAETVQISDDGEKFDLALPLQSNADRLREAMGFQPPHPITGTLEKTPLWLFTPLAEGWVHWPFPNATTALLGEHAAALDEPTPQPGSVAAGVWSVAQAENGSERVWDLSLFGAQAANLETRFVLADWTLKSHRLSFQGTSVIFDGLLPVTAFAQTPDQFLPEPQSRALAPEALEAVSPDLLTGLEAQLWARRGKETDKKRAVYAAVSMAPLTLSPKGKVSEGTASVAFDGAPVSLEIGWPGDVPTMRPWAWLRHHQLPSLQTMPLCLAGKRRNVPSGTREFAPFVGPAPAGRTTRLRFSGGIDMGAPHVALDFSGEDAAWTHPLKDANWISEIGQVFPTLTSITVYPGDTADRSIKHDPGKKFFGPLKPAQGISIAHDMATTHELHAFAALPPPKPKEDENNRETPPAPKASDPTFRPGPWNAPGSDAGSSSWLDVWTDLNRKLAVSAVEKSDLVAREGNQHSLPNLLLDQTYKLTAQPDISTEIVYGTQEPEFGAPSETEDLLTNLGRLELDIENAGKVILRGLPSTEELSGLSLGLKRSLTDENGAVRSETVQVNLGTLDQIGLENVDQGGWQYQNNHQADGVFVRTARRYRKDDTRRWALVTRETALTISTKDRPDIRLSLQDLACFGQKDKTWIFTAEANGADHRLGVDRNAIEGHSWALEQKDLADHVMVGHLAFRALVLRSVVLNEDFSPAKATFDGVVATPLPGWDGSGLALAEGLGAAQLTISWTGGDAKMELSASELMLPLADPGRSWPPVPWLEVDSMTYSSGKTLAGTSVMLRAESESVALALKLRKGDPTPAAEKTLRLTLSDLALGEVSRAGGAWIAKPAQADVSIDAEMRLNTLADDKGGARAEMHLTAELIPGRIAGHSHLHLGRLESKILLDQSPFDGTEAERKMQRPIDGKLSEIDLFGTLSRHEFATRFHVPSIDPQPVVPETTSPFAGLLPSGREATLLCVLGAEKDHSEDQIFELVSVAATARLTYAAKRNRKNPKTGKIEEDTPVSATLVYVSGDPAAKEKDLGQGRDLRLYLRAEAENAIPLPTITDQGKHASGSLFKHRIVAEVRGARLPLDRLDPGALQVSASTRHSFELTERTFTLNLVQSIALAGAEAVHEAIHAEITDATSSVFGPGTEGASIWAYLELSDLAMPHGLSDAMVDDLHDYKGVAPVLFAGTHALIGDLAGGSGGGSTDLTRLPLPFVSAFLDGPLFPSLAETDWTLKRRPPPAHPAVENGPINAMQRRLNIARDAAKRELDDLANKLLWPDAGLNRPMFPSSNKISADGVTWTPADQTVPATETGAVLSDWFAIEEARPAPGVAYGLVATAPDYKQFLGPDFVHSNQSTLKSAEVLLKSWEKMPTADRNILPGGADVVVAPASTATVWVRVLARSTVSDRLIEVASTQRQLEAKTIDEKIDEEIEALLSWGHIALSRRAPWARAGVLTAITTSGLQRLQVISRPLYSIAASSQLTDARTRFDGGPRKPEPNRLPSRADAGEANERALVPGYQAAGHHVEVVTSEPVAVLGEPETEARLTSVAAVSAYALATSDTRRVLASGQAAWLSDRETLAPRPATAFDGGAKTRLAPASAPGTSLPRPTAFHPSEAGQTGLPNEAEDENTRVFVPSAQVVATVGGRAGVMAARRLGLSVQPKNEPTAIRAAETATALRSPRPVILGVSDRTRSSSFEDGHFALTNTPEAMVYGPGRPIDILGQANDALDRSPRAQYAFVLQLTDPAAGLITAGQGAALTLTVANVFGDATPDAPPEWIIESASIRVGDFRYQNQFGKDAPRKLKIKVGATKELAAFTQVVGTPETAPASAGDAMAALPLGSEAELTLILSGDGTIRLVTLPLFARSATAPLIETPAFLRFDDPEYNDTLAGTARVGASTELFNGFSSAAYADRKEIADGDFLVFGLEMTEAPKGWHLAVQNGELKAFDGTTTHAVQLAIEVKRPNTEDGGEPEAPKITVAPLVSLVEGSSFAVLCLSLFLATSSAQVFDPDTGSPAPVLQPKDTLRITITVAGGTDRKIELDFDVVQIPSEPSNPSAYGLLRLDQPKSGKEQVSLPLYGRGSPANVIEMVDPGELRLGQVRRRAHYRWFSFQHIAATTAARATLQKSGRTGTTWLPGNLATGWTQFAKRRPVD